MKKIKNKFTINTPIKNINVIEETKKDNDFYNYKDWREIQRNQLGISANLYFVFSSAIFGFTLNFLLADKCKNTLNCPVKVILCFSLIFLLISLVFYAIFTENRLNDFRKTAELINEGKSNGEIKDITKPIGINSWSYHNNQRYFLFIGFVISLVGFSIYLFN